MRSYLLQRNRNILFFFILCARSDKKNISFCPIKILIKTAIVLLLVRWRILTCGIWSRHGNPKMRWKVSRARMLALNGIQIGALIIQRQIRWISYFIRMLEDRIPKMILYGELLEGQWYVEVQEKKKFQNQLKVMLKRCGINSAKLEQPITGGHYAVRPLKDLKLSELKTRNFHGNNVIIT